MQDQRAADLGEKTAAAMFMASRRTLNIPANGTITQGQTTALVYAIIRIVVLFCTSSDQPIVTAQRACDAIRREVAQDLTDALSK